MKKLQINFMNNLQNCEFAILYDQLCSIIEPEQLEDEHAQRACRATKNHTSEIAYISNDPRTHNLTGVINEQVRNRTNYLISLRMQVDGLKLSFCEEERASALVLSNWLQQQGKRLYIPSIISQSRLVDNLTQVRKLNNELEKAIIFLRFNHHIDAIVAINKEIDENFMKRNNEMSEGSKKSKAIRKAAYHDLKIFISFINLFVDLSIEAKEDTIYHQYTRKINKLLTHYHTKLKSRTTKRKNKKEVAAAVKNLINSQQDPQKALPMGVDELKVENVVLRNPQNIAKEVKQYSGDSSISNKGEKKEAKGGNGKLPPISKN